MYYSDFVFRSNSRCGVLAELKGPAMTVRGILAAAFVHPQCLDLPGGCD